MDFKDLMNQMGIDVYTVDNTGVELYKPEENPLHKHSYKFNYTTETYICTTCNHESELLV